MVKRIRYSGHVKVVNVGNATVKAKLANMEDLKTFHIIDLTISDILLPAARTDSNCGSQLQNQKHQRLEVFDFQEGTLFTFCDHSSIPSFHSTYFIIIHHSACRYELRTASVSEQWIYL